MLVCATIINAQESSDAFNEKGLSERERLIIKLCDTNTQILVNGSFILKNKVLFTIV